MSRSIAAPILLLLLAAVLFGINLGTHGLWPADEPRYAQVAREMMQSGDYLAPRVNGEGYLEKPPLLFWSMALFSLPVGDVTPVTARIPSFLSALLTLFLTWLLAKRMFGDRVAFWSAIVLMTGYRFWWQASFAQIDMLLTGCMTVVLYHLWRWEEDRKGWRLPVIYGAMAAGMLAKGPPALIFPLLLIFAFYWRKKDDRKALHWVIGCAAAMLVVALWYVPARFALAGAGEQAVSEGIGGNLIRNTVGRMVMGVSKAQWPWYYLFQTPLDWLPWALFLPWVAVRTWKQRHADKMRHFLWCWTFPAFIFFSISIGKRAIYLLPLFPAIAIFVALALIELMDSDRMAWRRRTGLLWAGLLLLLGLVPHVLPLTEYRSVYTLHVALFSLMILFLGGYALRRALMTDGRALHGLMASQMALLLAGAAVAVFPAMDPYKSAELICAPVRALAEKGADFDLYSLGFSREQYIYYSKHFHEPVLTDLVGRAEIPPDELMDAVRKQRHARKTIVNAVEEVPVADLEAITPEERAALAAAMHQALEEEEEKLSGVLKFEDDLRAELDAFAGRFGGERPAFLYVQHGDWRWVMPLLPDSLEYNVISQRSVGRREALLLANSAGMALLDRMNVSR